MATVTKERVGRGGFRGSPITSWCGSCRDWVVRLNNGECGWCGAHERPKKQPSKKDQRARASAQVDAEVARLRALGFTHREIGQRLFMHERKVRDRLARVAA
jgi:hypothetical protein